LKNKLSLVVSEKNKQTVMKKIHVIIDNHSLECLERLSKENNWSKSGTIRAAIQKMSGNALNSNIVAKVKIGRPPKKVGIIFSNSCHS